MNPNIVHHVTPGGRIKTTKCGLRFRPRMNITTDWILCCCRNCARTEGSPVQSLTEETTGFQKRFQAEEGGR